MNLQKVQHLLAYLSELKGIAGNNLSMEMRRDVELRIERVCESLEREIGLESHKSSGAKIFGEDGPEYVRLASKSGSVTFE